MPSTVTYLLWIEVALVAIVAVLALVWALRGAKLRRVKPGSQIIVGLLPFVAVWGVLAVTGLALNPIFAVIAVVVGAGIGFLVARRAPLVPYAGRTVVKPSAVSGWVSAVAWVLVGASVAFLGPNSVSAALLIALLGAAMSFAETMTHAIRGRGVTA